MSDDNDHLYSMYGVSKRVGEPANRGVDVSGRGKLISLTVDGQKVLLPSPTYVAELERKLAEQTRALLRMERRLTAIQRQLTSHNRSMDQMNIDMDNKIDRNGY